jgi:hypothetical protein
LCLNMTYELCDIFLPTCYHMKLAFSNITLNSMKLVIALQVIIILPWIKIYFTIWPISIRYESHNFLIVSLQKKGDLACSLIHISHCISIHIGHIVKYILIHGRIIHVHQTENTLSFSPFRPLVESG